MTYIVCTFDVDGSTRRTYKTRAAAIRRFEEMLGYSMTSAIWEAYHAIPEDRHPTPDTVRRVGAVGHFGNRVTFEAVEGATQ
jgi:hypothetical protein